VKQRTRAAKNLSLARGSPRIRELAEMAAMSSRCAASSSSSAFLGAPLPGGRHHQGSCGFVAAGGGAKTTVRVAAALDTEATAKAGKSSSRARRARKDGGEPGGSSSTALLAPTHPDGGGGGGVALDDVIVNPVGLGRRSRQIFDEVWRKFSRLGQMSTVASPEQEEQEGVLFRGGGPMCDFAVPGAQDTTVLVVGATSRIVRIVVRKLMLRGYNVKVTYFYLFFLVKLSHVKSTNYDQGCV
jgi:E1A/CREB-binding protein